MSNVSIIGLGKALPSRVVLNLEIEERLGLNPGWIESRTGIRERRMASPDDSAASLGLEAARGAIANSGTPAESIDTVIVATCTPDYVFPPCATIIQSALGIPTSAGAFDLSAACSGFVYALNVAAGLAAAGTARTILIVGVDLLSRHLNLDDPVTAPLFGDGAGAVLVTADENAAPIRFEMGSDGSGAEQVIVPGSGSRLATDPAALACIRMTGRDVYRNAVRTMTAQGARLGADGFDLLVAHQANRRILDECAAQLGIESEKVFMNIEKYGNTSAGSVPIALCEAWEQGRLSPGDRLLILAFGAGFTWGGALMRWTMAKPVSPDSAVAAHPGSPLAPVGAK
ncbi:MAG: 3-oxoacyl-ACP synthase III family protein [Actinomycetota bacterium]